MQHIEGLGDGRGSGWWAALGERLLTMWQAIQGKPRRMRIFPRREIPPALRLILVFGTLAASLLIFLLLYRQTGRGMWASLVNMSLIPAALFWGLRGGVLMALICSLIGGWLSLHILHPYDLGAFCSVLMGSLTICLLIGAALGRLRDLTVWLRREIARRQEIEEALQSREAQYRELYNNMSSGVAVYEACEDGADFVFKDMNKAGERITQVRKEEIVGHRVSEVFPGVQEMGLLDVLRRVWRTGEPQHHPTTLYQDDRLCKWFENYVYKLPGGEVVAVYDDITQRKRAEEALRQERNLLRTLMDNLPAYVFVKDCEGRFITTNAAHLKVLGERTLEEVIGKTDADLFPPELAEQYMQLERKVIRTEQPIYDREEYTVDLQGGVQWLSTTKVPLRDAEGRVVGLVGISHDITARKEAQEKLAWENRLNGALARLSQALLMEASLDNISALVLEDARRLTESPFGFVGYTDPSTGYLIAPTMTRDVWEICKIPDKSIVLQKFGGLLGWVLREHQPLVTNDPSHDTRSEGAPEGHIPIQRFLAAPALLQGELVGTVALANAPRDYTERDQLAVERLAALYALAVQRQRTQQQLQHYASELERRNEEIKHFAYIVSHDLRAPLVNLKGFASELHLAIETISEALDREKMCLDKSRWEECRLALEEDIPEALGFIESSVTHMDHFISAVLTLSRLGRRELTFEELDARQIVEGILPTLQHQIEAHEAEVTIGDLPPVIADRTSMEQILGNLLSNAVKYLEPERPGRIAIGGERHASETVFWVRDNGRGIAQEDAEKVFMPFRRAGKQDVPGEGVGLAYVQTLVRRHGGRMWFESELGVGSTFYFTISHDLNNGAHHD